MPKTKSGAYRNVTIINHHLTERVLNRMDLWMPFLRLCYFFPKRVIWHRNCTHIPKSVWSFQKGSLDTWIDYLFTFINLWKGPSMSMAYLFKQLDPTLNGARLMKRPSAGFTFTRAGPGWNSLSPSAKIEGHNAWGPVWGSGACSSVSMRPRGKNSGAGPGGESPGSC